MTVVALWPEGRWDGPECSLCFPGCMLQSAWGHGCMLWIAERLWPEHSVESPSGRPPHADTRHSLQYNIFYSSLRWSCRLKKISRNKDFFVPNHCFWVWSRGRGGSTVSGGTTCWTQSECWAARGWRPSPDLVHLCIHHPLPAQPASPPLPGSRYV